jgi:hypothetical protein
LLGLQQLQQTAPCPPARPLDSPLCHPHTSVYLYVAFLSTNSAVLVTSDISDVQQLSPGPCSGQILDLKT